jgi:hypothetical protein
LSYGGPKPPPPPPPPPTTPAPPRQTRTPQHANPGPQLSVGHRSHLHGACGRVGRLSKGDLTEGAELELVQRGLGGLARRLGLEGAQAQLVGRDLQPHVMRAPVLIELRELLAGQHDMQQPHGPRLVARGAQVEPQLPRLRFRRLQSRCRRPLGLQSVTVARGDFEHTQRVGDAQARRRGRGWLRGAPWAGLGELAGWSLCP